MNENNGAMLAVMGLTTVELVKLWQSVAPTMLEVRAAPKDDPATMARLMDANMLGAGLAIMIGGTTSYLLKSWLPLFMALGSVILVSQWHLAVYNAEHGFMTKENNE
jgi:hypothetical protein